MIRSFVNRSEKMKIHWGKSLGIYQLLYNVLDTTVFLKQRTESFKLPKIFRNN